MIILIKVYYIFKIDNFSFITKYQFFLIGLAYMLDNKFIDDAFVLHDQTADSKHLKNFYEFVKDTLNDGEILSQDFIDLYLNILKNYKLNDSRKNLDDRWAKFSNIFKMQPMWSIRK